MTGVESSCAGERVRSPQNGARLTGRAGHDSPAGVDRGSYAGIGIKQQPAIVFDGAHAGLLEMLCVGSAVAIPAVVGNVHQRLRPIVGKLSDLVWEDGFVTDERTELVPARIEGRAGSASREVSYLLGQASSK